MELDALNYFGIMTYGSGPAESYYRDLQDAMNALTQHPFIHRERDEVRPPVRLLVFRAHNVFYDVTDEDVVIVRVLHHTADWMKDV